MDSFRAGACMFCNGGTGDARRHEGKGTPFASSIRRPLQTQKRKQTRKTSIRRSDSIAFGHRDSIRSKANQKIDLPLGTRTRPRLRRQSDGPGRPGSERTTRTHDARRRNAREGYIRSVEQTIWCARLAPVVDRSRPRMGAADPRLTVYSRLNWWRARARPWKQQDG